MRFMMSPFVLAFIVWVSSTSGAAPQPSSATAAACPPYNAAKVADPLPLVSATNPTGATSGSFSVGTDGAAHYSIPLTAIPGLRGMTPALAISYSSRGGNGYLGVGFSLAGPTSISRCPKTIADDGVTQGVRLDVTDKFCLSGMPLVAVNGIYGAHGTEYRTSPETFVRVRSFRTSAGSPDDGPDHFEVRSKDGLIETYGLGDTDFVESHRVAWPITEARDPLGNRIKFIYKAVEGSTDPDTIISRRLVEVQYGNFNAIISGSSTPDRRVLFTYGDRPDPLSTYTLGHLLSVRHRLTKIEMQRLAAVSDGSYTNARSYHLSYQNDGATGYSKLRSVQQCGSSPTACLPATTFDWELGAVGFEAGKVQPLSVAPISTMGPLIVLDLDGDGKDDLAFADAAPEPGIQWFWRMLPSSGGSPFIDHNVFTLPQEGFTREALAIDYDLDGRTDLLPRNSTTDENKPWRPLLSRGGGLTPRSMVEVNTAFAGPVNQRDRFSTFGDLDGDGYEDTLEHVFQPIVGGPPAAWYYRLRTGDVSAAIKEPVPQPGALDSLAFEEKQLIGQLDSVASDHAFLLDLNGDGRSEIVFKQAIHDGLRALNVPQPSHVGGDFDVGLPAWILSDGVQRVFGDFNGDGLIDLVTNVALPENIGQPPNNLLPKVFIWFNKGRGFTGAMLAISTTMAFDLQHAVVIDYNGDGKQDLLVPAPTTLPFSPPVAKFDMHLLQMSTESQRFEVHQNIGITFQVPVNKVAPDIERYEISRFYFDWQGPRVLDADGDGQDDIIVIDRNTVNPTTASQNQFLYYGHKRTHDRHDQMQGLPDHMIGVHEGSTPSPTTLSIQYAPLTAPWVYTRSGCDHLKHFNCSINPHYVVDEVRRNAGLPGESQNTTIVSEHDYKNSITHKTSREWLGFAEQRVQTAPSDQSQLPVITRRFYSNTVAKRDPRLLEEWRYGFLPDGRIWLERRRQTWGQKDTPLPTGHSLPYDFVEISETSSYEFPSGTTTLSQLNTISPAELDQQDGIAHQFRFRTALQDQILAQDNFGNVTKRRSFFGPGSFQTIIDTSYDVDPESWLLNRPRKVITTQILDPGCTTPADCSETSTTEFVEYLRTKDGVPTPLPLKVRSFHTDAAPGPILETFHSYDTFGNRTHTTVSGDVDGKGTIARRESCTTYDPDGVFPHAMSNTLGHIAYMRVDPLLGLPTVAVDPKGRRSDTQYDTLGRPVKVRQPSGAESITSYFTELSAGTVLSGIETRDGTGHKAQVLADRLGRPVIERFAGFDGVMRVATRTYDATGTVVRQDGMPVRIGSAPPLAILSTYDSRGRKLTQTEPNTSDPTHPYVRSWRYERRNVISTDTRGNVTRQEYDIAGNLGRTVEAVGKPEQIIRNYKYGLFHRLKSTDVEGRPHTATQYTYDYRGNVLSRQDPDRGLATSQYNAFNEPILTRDANGREGRPNYDALGRVVSLRVDEAQANAKKLLSITTYTYDVEPVTQQVEPGKLTRIQRDDFVSTTAEGDEQRTQLDYDYDEALGRLAAVTHTIPSDINPGTSTVYTVRYTYDAFNRVQTMQYPKLPGQTTPLSVSYQYAVPPGNGQLRTINANDNGTVQSLWTLLGTDEANRFMTSTTGDGISTVRQYDWRGAQATQVLQTAPNDVCPNCRRASAHYFYDGEGNLDRRVDLQQGETERFVYDAFDGVTKTTIDSLPQSPQTWTYDALGNVLTNTHRGIYHYDDPTRPMRVTSVTGGKIGTTRAYGYDAVGNQVTRPGTKVIYNELNLPARLLESNGQNLAEFLYGPGGERVRKSSKAAGVVTYVGALYQHHRRGSTVEHKLLVPGIAVISYKETGGVLTKQPTLFLHSDHLGSMQAITADDDPGPGVKAVVKEVRSYDAFGLGRNPNWKSGSYTDIPTPLTTEGYTGHNDDPELGLIDMKGRIYDPQLARFLTPDPVVARPTTTQSWNPYGYVSNNPLRNTDPSGFEECAGCDDFWNAGEAYWGGGGAGLAEYGRGQLEREFTNLFYRMQRHESAWGDGKQGDRLHKYSEKRIKKTACTIGAGTTTLGTRETPLGNCSGTVSSDNTSTGGNGTTSPGMTDAEADEYLKAYCAVNLCANEVGVYGQLTEWDKMWCRGAGCFDVTHKSQQWAENLGFIESFATVYAGMWTAVGTGGLAAEISLGGLEGATAAARAKALANAAAARAAMAPVHASAAAAVATKGTATVYEHIGRHTSIIVQYGEQLMHTEQSPLAGYELGTMMTVREWTSGVSVVNQMTLQLPNAKAAIEYQRSLLGQMMGPYNSMTNSCVTHCGDVLRQGGLDAPTTTRRIVHWLLGQKQP